MITFLRVNDGDESTHSPKPQTRIFCKNSYHYQQLSLPPTVMDYLLNAKNGKVNNKLGNSCKYFYLKNPCIVIDKFDINYFNYDDHEIYQKYPYKTYITSSESLPSKLWIVDQFICHSFCYGKSIQKILPKIFRCDATFICLKFTNLAEIEFDFLINPQVLKMIYLQWVKISNLEGRELKITNIVKKVPNATHLGFVIHHTSPDQKENLASIIMNVKVECLKILDINETFNLEDCFKFVETNFTNDGTFILCDFESNEAYIDKAQKAFQKLSENGNKKSIKFYCDVKNNSII